MTRETPGRLRRRGEVFFSAHSGKSQLGVDRAARTQTSPVKKAGGGLAVGKAAALASSRSTSGPLVALPAS